MAEKELYQKAIEYWGEEAQIKMAIEECAELIMVLAKFGRKINGSPIWAIQEEIVDVEVMLEQLKEIFPTDYKLAKEGKLQRLSEYLKLHTEEAGG